jgi:transposase
MKPSQIASFLVMDTRTVKKYLAMSEQEYLDYQERLIYRTKKLSVFEDFIKQRIESCPQASSAQVHDWLKEYHPDFKDVSTKTIYNFVLHLRDKYGLPKLFNTRPYCMVEELAYGKQVQADMGEYNMTDTEGHRKKVYFFAIVMARSRYKFVVFQEQPFTTGTIIIAHELAFAFIGGYPQEMVYDQDKVMLKDENIGDLILIDVFRSYCDNKPFKLHFCRKSDPESKGKVESVVKYIKYNFLRGRTFFNIHTLILRQ